MWGKNHKISELIREVQLQIQQGTNLQVPQANRNSQQTSSTGQNSSLTSQNRSFEIDLDDINYIQQCYTTREDNILHLRIYLMQLIENNSNGSSNLGSTSVMNKSTANTGSSFGAGTFNNPGMSSAMSVSSELRQIMQALHNLEKYRVQYEDIVIAKYATYVVSKSSLSNNQQNSSTLNSNSANNPNGNYGSGSSAGIKALGFKIFSKIHKLNLAYLTKIQLYFPKLYDIIFSEQLALNNSLKEHASQLISSNSLSLGKIFALVAKSGRQRLQKEMNRLQNFQSFYLNLGSEKNKNKQNERFYSDKHLQGLSSFSYVIGLQKKFFLRQNQQPFLKTLLMGKKSAQNAQSFYEDILNIEKKKAIPDQQGPVCVLTMPVVLREHESIIETILGNYEKYSKEWMQNNKYISFKIRVYSQAVAKFNPLRKQRQFNREYGKFSPREQLNNNGGRNNSNTNQRDQQFLSDRYTKTDRQGDNLDRISTSLAPSLTEISQSKYVPKSSNDLSTSGKLPPVHNSKKNQNHSQNQQSSLVHIPQDSSDVQIVSPAESTQSIDQQLLRTPIQTEQRPSSQSQRESSSTSSISFKNIVSINANNTHESADNKDQTYADKNGYPSFSEFSSSTRKLSQQQQSSSKGQTSNDLMNQQQQHSRREHAPSLKSHYESDTKRDHTNPGTTAENDFSGKSTLSTRRLTSQQQQLGLISMARRPYLRRETDELKAQLSRRDSNDSEQISNIPHFPNEGNSQFQLLEPPLPLLPPPSLRPIRSMPNSLIIEENENTNKNSQMQQQQQQQTPIEENPFVLASFAGNNNNNRIPQEIEESSKVHENQRIHPGRFSEQLLDAEEETQQQLKVLATTQVHNNNNNNSSSNTSSLANFTLFSSMKSQNPSGLLPSITNPQQQQQPYQKRQLSSNILLAGNSVVANNTNNTNNTTSTTNMYPPSLIDQSAYPSKSSFRSSLSLSQQQLQYQSQQQQQQQQPFQQQLMPTSGLQQSSQPFHSPFQLASQIQEEQHPITGLNASSMKLNNRFSRANQLLIQSQLFSNIVQANVFSQQHQYQQQQQQQLIPMGFQGMSSNNNTNSQAPLSSYQSMQLQSPQSFQQNTLAGNISPAFFSSIIATNNNNNNSNSASTSTSKRQNFYQPSIITASIQQPLSTLQTPSNNNNNNVMQFAASTSSSSSLQGTQQQNFILTQSSNNAQQSSSALRNNLQSFSRNYSQANNPLVAAAATINNKNPSSNNNNNNNNNSFLPNTIAQQASSHSALNHTNMMSSKYIPQEISFKKLRNSLSNNPANKYSLVSQSILGIPTANNSNSNNNPNSNGKMNGIYNSNSSNSENTNNNMNSNQISGGLLNPNNPNSINPSNSSSSSYNFITNSYSNISNSYSMLANTKKASFMFLQNPEDLSKKSHRKTNHNSNNNARERQYYHLNGSIIQNNQIADISKINEENNNFNNFNNNNNNNNHNSSTFTELQDPNHANNSNTNRNNQIIESSRRHHKPGKIIAISVMEVEQEQEQQRRDGEQDNNMQPSQSSVSAYTQQQQQQQLPCLVKPNDAILLPSNPSNGTGLNASHFHTPTKQFLISPPRRLGNGQEQQQQQSNNY